MCLYVTKTENTCNGTPNQIKMAKWLVFKNKYWIMIFCSAFTTAQRNYPNQVFLTLDYAVMLSAYWWSTICCTNRVTNYVFDDQLWLHVVNFK